MRFPTRRRRALVASALLVRLENASENTESVRLQIRLDGSPEYDTSRDLMRGEFLEYAYQRLSY